MYVIEQKIQNVPQWVNFVMIGIVVARVVHAVSIAIPWRTSRALGHFTPNIR